ncbi:MAG TPA: hypothetical protein VGS12_14500 [Caulobacteraceae bacterium]|nr:hypothetical protein [Caulobacteraceae bacterium]
MPGIADHALITIRCPKCREEQKKTIGWVKVNERFTCSSGHEVAIRKDELIRGLDQVERELAKIPRKITLKL